MLWKKLLVQLKNKQLYFSYLLSLITILLLFSISFPLVYRGYFAPRYEAKVERQMLEIFEKNKLHADSNLRQFHQIASIIAADPAFSVHAIDNSIMAWHDIAQKLQQYQSINPALYDTLYVHRDTPLIYSTSGINNPAYFPLSRVNLYGGQHLEQAVFLPGKNDLLNATSQRNIIEYALPIMQGSAALIFQISGDKLISPDESLSAAEHAGMALLGLDGTLIYHTGSTHADALLYAACSARAQTANGMRLYALPSSYAGATYLFWVPDQYMMREINAMNYAFALCIGISALVGIALALLLANRSYRPIRRLSGVLQHVAADIPSHLNETDAAGYAIGHLSSMTYRLKQEVAQAERRRALRLLLNRDFNPDDAFAALCDRAGLPLTMPPALIMILSRRTAHPVPPLATAVGRASLALGEEAECFSIDYIQESSAVFFIAPLEEETRVRCAMARVATQLHEEHDGAFFLSAGPLCAQWEGVYASFSQARRIAQTQALCAPALPYCDTPTHHAAHSAPYHHPQAELAGLQTAIHQNSGDRIEFMVDMLLDSVRANAHHSLSALCLSYEIVGILLRALDVPDAAPAANDLLEQNTLNFEPLARQYTAALLARIAALDHRQSDRHYQQMLSYILDNIEDPALCVNAIGYHLRVHPSYVSQLFKARAGMTPSDYISGLRLEKARALLLSTPCSIGDIAHTLGYAQTSSFIRRFKAVYGITPGEYRQQPVGVE